MQTEETTRPEDVRLFTIADLVGMTRIGRTRIYEEIAAGRLRTVHFGRAVRVRSDDYARWVEERTEAGAA
jgi:excisionase family DNA binding protein